MSKVTANVTFVHPDLGIGGAERLIVDAAVGLKSEGHQVVIYTSHHDKDHCFEETRDGTIIVKVYGDFLPRSVFGKCHILFAMIRGFYLSLVVLLHSFSQSFDVLFIDQLSSYIPVLRFTGAKILFYCHFPDKLLTKRQSFLKRLYRMPIDFFEETTTNMADEIVVNSKFTRSIFKEAFPSIKKLPVVLYPGIRLESYDKKVDLKDSSVLPLISEKIMIVSINRFERKKNIALAIQAYAEIKNLDEALFNDCVLVIAGGYDHRVAENLEYLKELEAICTSLSLNFKTILPSTSEYPKPSSSDQIIFLASFNEAQRTYLFSASKALVYTPSWEHFGIVPIESMYAGLPVVAVNNGGPLETILDGKTGFLCVSEKEKFADAIVWLLKNRGLDKRCFESFAKEHVQEKFSLDIFISSLDRIVEKLARQEKLGTPWFFWFGVVALAIILSFKLT